MAKAKAPFVVVVALISAGVLVLAGWRVGLLILSVFALFIAGGWVASPVGAWMARRIDPVAHAGGWVDVDDTGTLHIYDTGFFRPERLVRSVELRDACVVDWSLDPRDPSGTAQVDLDIDDPREDAPYETTLTIPWRIMRVSPQAQAKLVEAINTHALRCSFDLLPIEEQR